MALWDGQCHSRCSWGVHLQHFGPSDVDPLAGVETLEDTLEAAPPNTLTVPFETTGGIPFLWFRL